MAHTKFPSSVVRFPHELRDREDYMSDVLGVGRWRKLNPLYVVITCLALGYCLAGESYRVGVRPFNDLWPNDYNIFGIVLIVTSLLFYSFKEVYPHRFRYLPMLSATMAMIVLYLLFSLYSRQAHFSGNALLPFLWAGSWFIATFATAELVGFCASHLARISPWRPTIAVLGDVEAATRMANALRNHPRLSVKLLGVYEIDAASGWDGADEQPGLRSLIEVGKNFAIDRIILTLPKSSEHAVQRIVAALLPLASDIVSCAGDEAGARGSARPNMASPAVLVARQPLTDLCLILKTVEDFVLGTALLIVFAPLMALIALAVKLDSRGPVLFSQKRHGYRNREIFVLKFRSMRIDSLDHVCNRQTLRHDPRTTRVGRFLRKSSLDELPQLFNVLRGEMSLVGPRPHALNMRTEDRLCHEIVPHYANRHRVKPGITGWAQVNGFRGAMNSENLLIKRVEYDLEYIERCSILFDIEILLRTIVHLSSPKNAF